jgi:hypothetical protein
MASLGHVDLTKLNLTGEVPELLHNRKLLRLLDFKYDPSLDLPRVKRTCINGLDLYLPYLVRTHGSGNTFAVECAQRTSPAGSSIPEWIGVVTGLTKLNLFRNNMVGTLPTGLGLLTKMTQL